MKWFYTELHRQHDAEVEVWAGVPAPSTEVGARAEAIASTLSGDPFFVAARTKEHGIDPIERVHNPAMVRWLEGAWNECRPFSKRREVIPDTIRHAGMVAGLVQGVEPIGSPFGRLGYWCFDTMTPIVEGTYSAARGAVDVALSALDAVMDGEGSSYALCRPPGHHAATSVMGGFCYFNNAAIVASQMAEKTGAPVAILDVDYHHGNGTQQVFYERGDVVYVSLHADPDREFPYFSGRADEKGQGSGRGANRNFPLASGVGDAEYLQTLERALDFISESGARSLVVSLGLDTYELDPLGDLKLTKDAYWQMGHMVGKLALPTVIVQEGGYYIPDLGANVSSWLKGFARSDEGEAGSSAVASSDAAESADA